MYDELVRQKQTQSHPCGCLPQHHSFKSGLNPFSRPLMFLISGATRQTFFRWSRSVVPAFALVTHFVSPSAAAALSTHTDERASHSSKKPQVSASSILLHFLCSHELKMSLHHDSGLLLPHFKVSCDLKRRRAFIWLEEHMTHMSEGTTGLHHAPLRWSLSLSPTDPEYPFITSACALNPAPSVRGGEASRITYYEPCAVTSDSYALGRGFCPPGTGGRAGWPAPFIKLLARTRQTDDPSVLQSDLRFRDNNVSVALCFRGKSSSLEGYSSWLCCCLYVSVQPGAEERGRVTSFPFLACT